ncbi:nuclear GTPase SLIP-GC-like [Aplochiton taeniatus]
METLLKESCFLINNRKKISAAETNKQELVGVFGKTGAGKSSLINAVLGEKDLLPSGGITACTSVMVKVEANMINSKYMAEIEFITKEASALSIGMVKYIRTGSQNANDTERYYWPLVKCVTIKLPDAADLLEHVALVDLPGTGDCNKSRDEMWKSLLGSVSAVWIVSDTNRAASEKEPWEILNSTISLMGNGGECRSISFICSKSDLIEDFT